jgi:hypothetical protein
MHYLLRVITRLAMREMRCGRVWKAPENTEGYRIRRTRPIATCCVCDEALLGEVWQA